MTKRKNQKIFFIILALLIVFSVGIWYMISKGTQISPTNSGTGTISVRIIGDKRCNGCITKEISDKIKEAPFLANAKFQEQDFSDSGVEAYLKTNDIKFLPAFIFSTNDIVDDTGISNFLTPLKDGNFTLEVGSKFDPFGKRSPKGFLILDKNKFDSIKKDSYIDGDSKAKITWIEYSDIQCPYCAQLHNSGVIETLQTKYGTTLNRIFQHFPITQAHKDALPAGQLLECAGEQGRATKFYELAKNVYAAKKSDKAFILEEATKVGLDSGKMDVCLNEEKYKDKVLGQQKLGQDIFGVSSTPTSIMINNETLEYEELNGALPVNKFEEVIDKLLK